jgi:hypothetical protein
VIACLLTGLCIVSKLRPLQSLCGGGTMGCGEVWKMPMDGPSHVAAVFAYGRHARRWHGSHSCGPVIATPLQSTDAEAVVHPARAAKISPKRSIIPNYLPLHIACGVGDHAGEACQSSPQSSVSLPAIRQIILEAPASLGRQQGDRPSCPDAVTPSTLPGGKPTRSAHPDYRLGNF